MFNSGRSGAKFVFWQSSATRQNEAGIPWDATGLRICASWPSKREQFEQSVDSPRNPRESQYALRAESFELLPGSLENLDESCPPFEGRKFLKK